MVRPLDDDPGARLERKPLMVGRREEAGWLLPYRLVLIELVDKVGIAGKIAAANAPDVVDSSIRRYANTSKSHSRTDRVGTR